LCYNPTNNKVYCANYGGNNVSVIDGASDSVLATVAAGSEPCALCYNPTNDKTYCANTGGNVTVIDGSSDSVLANVVAGSEPLALCCNPTNNKVYCVNEFSDDVTVIDGVSDSVLATVTAGIMPCALGYEPTENKAYCANQGGNVTVIDGATNQVLRTIGVGISPCAFTWNPAQNRVYVANEGSSSVSVLRDSATGIEESMTHDAGRMTLYAGPTIVRGVLELPGGSDFPVAKSRGSETSPTFLLDISGRKVQDLKPGPNDVSRLASGVYFVRSEPSAVSREPSTVHKVVLAR
jgi:YVTN family beta-propeller protein